MSVRPAATMLVCPHAVMPLRDAGLPASSVAEGGVVAVVVSRLAPCADLAGDAGGLAAKVAVPGLRPPLFALRV